MITPRALTILTLCLTAAAAQADPDGGRRTDAVVLGVTAEPPNLDPAQAGPAGREIVMGGVFETLTRIGPDGKIQPYLAEKWSADADGKVWTFELRQNVKFHNGVEFNARTAKFALDAARRPDSGNPLKQVFNSVGLIEAVDSHRLSIKLEAPTAELPFLLAQPEGAMTEPTSAPANRTNPIGTGPYRFAAWTRGEKIDLTRHAAAWRGATAKIDRVTFRFLSTAQDQARALKSGEVQAIPAVASAEVYNELTKDKRFVGLAGLTETEVVAGVNNARRPFNDVRVRRALAMALDRGQLVQRATGGYGKPIGAHFSPLHPAYVDLTGVNAHNVAQAKTLLSEAGFSGGLELTIKAPNLPYAKTTAEGMAEMFAAIGVKAKIELLDFPGKWMDQVFRQRDFEVTVMAHPEALDLGVYAKDSYYFNYLNPEFRLLMVEARRQINDDQRYDTYRRAQKMLAEDAPALFLYQTPKLGIWRTGLQGAAANQSIPALDLAQLRWGS